jgi:hypothetical protein
MKLKKNLVLSIPRLEIHRPPISTAIVANAIKQKGYPVECLDLNIKFFHFLQDRNVYYKMDEVWDGNRQISLTELKIVIKFLQKYYRPQAEKYDRICISIFGSSARLFGEILCRFTRKHLKAKEIVIGGAGVISANPTVNAEEKCFGEQMQDKGLIDYWISGEGEQAIIKLLQNETSFTGINTKSYQQINELDNLPFPDYSFFDLDEYDYLQKEKEVFIVGSRGCVRRCTYCDVARYWPKFRYRSGKNIADEIISHYEKHGITKFFFTDSLINGSLKAFRDMCNNLAKYNQEHNCGFKWGGQFIFRPSHQVSEEHFHMISQAGGEQFYVGVETGSDKIRWEMDKKFTNKDIDYQLEMFSKFNLKVYFLMLLGYLTETQKDHEDTLQMFPRWQKYVADGTISGIDLSTQLHFLGDTPLEKMIESHGVYFFDADIDKSYHKDFSLWQSTSNPALTIQERLRRRVETHKEAIKYNWPIWRGPQRLSSVKNIAKKYLTYLEKNQSTTNVMDQTGLFWIE